MTLQNREITQVSSSGHNLKGESMEQTQNLFGLKAKFQNIKELENQILQFDRHKETQVLWKDMNGEVKESKEHKGILNISRNSLSSVMSKRYQLVNHTEVILPLVDILKGLNMIDVSGYTYNDGRKAYCMIWFEDSKTQVEVQKGDIIKLGLLISNSVDGSRALTSEVFGLRLVCLNGMTTKNLIDTFRKVHIGRRLSEDIGEISGKFYADTIIKITQYNDRLKDIVERAVAENIKSELYEMLLNGVDLPQKHIEKLLERLKEFDSMNKWNLYNHITNYLTFLKTKIGFERRLSLMKCANQILVADSQNLIESGREILIKRKAEQHLKLMG